LGLAVITSVTTSRFVTLDAFRGVASITVVLFHAGLDLGAYVPRFGYLAVDLFFLLSGFVLSRAYDRRLAGGMGIFEFLSIRVVRLFPLFFLGLVLGIPVTFMNIKIVEASFHDIGVHLAFNIFGLPSLINDQANFQAPGIQLLFPINLPFWSIFAEFWIANVVFVLLAKFAGNKTVMLLVAASCVGLFFNEHANYTMDAGAIWNRFWGVFPRVGYSFFCGVLISRMAVSRLPPSVPAWCLSLTLVAILNLPLSGKAAHLFELMSVIFFFPVLIYFGASAIERFPRAGELLGDASYALYAIHSPLLVVLRWFTSSDQQAGIIQIVFTLTLLPFAWWLSKADTSFRRWLLSAFGRWHVPLRLQR
jgi:peptidoglycan/LPS O-acetylase OafA/YrhL